MNVLAEIILHPGWLFFYLLMGYLAVAYWRGHLGSLLDWVGKAMSTRETDGSFTPSTKRIIAAGSACIVGWGYRELIIASRKWIEVGNDPTKLLLAHLIALLAFGGLVYVGGKVLERIGLMAADEGPKE